jgi:hypothetical protein
MKRLSTLVTLGTVPLPLLACRLAPEADPRRQCEVRQAAHARDHARDSDLRPGWQRDRLDQLSAGSLISGRAGAGEEQLECG